MKLNFTPHGTSGPRTSAAPSAIERRGKPVLFAVACALSASAHATFFNNSTGLDKPDQTVTFESAVLTTAPVTTQFQEFGVTFSTAFPNPAPGAYPNISGNRLGNFTPGNEQSGLFTAYFSGVLEQVAFAMVTTPGVATIQALLGGVVVESASLPTTFTSDVNYYGFTDILFDRITVNVVSPDRALVIDNLQTVSAVPEPQTWAMFVAGLGLMGSLHRRRMR